MVETLRSIVHPWECDAVEHFTTAYYFRAFSAAQWHLMQLLDLSNSEMAAMRPVSCRAGFSQELRAGDAYHVESGIVDRSGEKLVLGHRMFNSETGTPCSTHLMTFAGSVESTPDTLRLGWDEETPGPGIDFGALEVWSTTSQSVVQSGDLDHAGRLDLCPLIHHTSDANVQFQNMIGMTSSYMLDQRIGFSTFGYHIRIHALPRTSGTVMRTDTALAHLGRSSLWFAHRVVSATSGEPIADVAQLGVHLDRSARRSSPIPDHIRAQAEGFLDSVRTP